MMNFRMATVAVGGVLVGAVVEVEAEGRRTCHATPLFAAALEVIAAFDEDALRDLDAIDVSAEAV